MVGMNMDQAAILRDIRGQLGTLAQFLMTLRDVPTGVDSVSKRTQTIEKKLTDVDLSLLDQAVENIQYASARIERSATISSRWKPNFFLGVILGCVFCAIGYFVGVQQSLPQHRANIEWAKQFNTPESKDLAIWTLREQDAARIASRMDENFLKWADSSAGRYARKFLAANAYLTNGECPNNLLKQTQIQGRTVCTVWKVEP